MKTVYKPQGSEKIERLDEKMKRIAELGNRNPRKEEKKLSSTGRLSTVLHEVEAPNGQKFAVVQENKYIYIKEQIDGNYEYISGVQNLKEHSYKNYATALKGLNLMVQSINEKLERGGMDILKKKSLS